MRFRPHIVAPFCTNLCSGSHSSVWICPSICIFIQRHMLVSWHVPLHAICIELSSFYALFCNAHGALVTLPNFILSILSLEQQWRKVNLYCLLLNLINQILQMTFNLGLLYQGHFKYCWLGEWSYSAAKGNSQKRHMKSNKEKISCSGNLQQNNMWFFSKWSEGRNTKMDISTAESLVV